MSHSTLPRTAARHSKSKRDARAIIRDVLLTVGILFLLYAAYEIWWTNVTSKHATNVAIGEIHRNWNRPQSPTHVITFGEGFALLYIPKLGASVHGLPIVQGTSKDALAKGAGHYSSSDLPGVSGNFAIAGHRSTHTEPFAHIDLLRAGDYAYVQTRDKWFKYKFVSSAIVTPQSLWVVDRNPAHLVEKYGSDQLMTITTCNPRWGSTERWVWWAVLVDTVSGNQAPDGLGAN